MLSSLRDLMYLIDSKDCTGIEGTFMSKIAADVAEGLLYLHENGIVHRDRKPANVLVSNHHYRAETNPNKIAYAWKNEPVICKLTDFGESRSLDIETRSVCHSRTKNIDRGTIPFMAPEILSGSQISQAGATLDDPRTHPGYLQIDMLRSC